MDGTELILNLIVATVVVGVEVLLLVFALRHARKDDSEGFQTLEPRFVADIRQRAGHGRSPDWIHYQAEMERFFEPRDERLRALAASALAVGLGGTIIALILNILFGQGMEEDPRSLIGGLGVALFGSLAGVCNNLFMTLVLLDHAQQRFQRASGGLLERLRQTSDEHPPTEAFTKTVKDELAGIRQALNQEFASAFSTAIGEFPLVVVKLGGHMDRLAEVVEAQSSSVSQAVHDLAACTRLVAESSRLLTPAVQQLAAVSVDLAAMPQRTAEVLEQHRESWLAELRDQHSERWQQLVEFQEKVERSSQLRENEMLGAVRDVREAIDQLPRQLAGEVNRVSNTFGNEFGREARHQVNELSAKLEEQQKLLLDRVANHEREWRNNIGTVVEDLFKMAGQQLEEHLVGELKVSASTLRESAQGLAKVAEGFEASHREWRGVQEDSLRGWQNTSERIAEAAAALDLGDEQLQRAVEALSQSADHLGRVARVSASFESDLHKALEKVSERHLEHVRPIHGELSDMVSELKAARENFDGILGQQSDFIQSLIDQIVRDRGVLEVQET